MAYREAQPVSLAAHTTASIESAGRGESGLPLPAAEDQFLASLVGRLAPHGHDLPPALGRLHEYLISTGAEPSRVRTTDLRGDLLERLFLWLTSVLRSRGPLHHRHLRGRGARLPALLRSPSPARADVSFEELRDNVREVMGRVPYRTPRIDQRLVLIVTHVDGLPLPPADQYGGQPFLELLRDTGGFRTLFTSGMRREEVSSLSRADVQDGYSRQALITGKGSKEADRLLRRPGAGRD